LSKPTSKSKPKKEPAKTTEVPEENTAVASSAVASVETPEKKNLIKERTPEEKQKDHRDGIIKTIVPAVLGIITGIISFSMYGAGENKVWYAVLMIVIALTYFMQKFIYPQIKIDVKEFKWKDWLYVEFIVLDFFLVTWTIFLN
jgi:EMC6-arch